MKEHPKRVSQEDVAAMLASAISIEQQRIEQLNTEAVDQVAGGLLPGGGFGPTMGMFPVEPVISW